MPAPFTTLAAFRSLLQALPQPDRVARAAAETRNAVLTKPAGALGRLEEVAIWFAGWQGREQPRMDQPLILIFAGNHGVTARGVSAFPPEVTVQMVANFHAGGAAVNQLARAFGARMKVCALELDRPVADFTAQAAMTEAEAVAALAAGWDAVDPDADLLVTGEMGIGNSTSAAALACALFGGPAAVWTGRGTGIGDAGLVLKTQVVAEGVARHGGAAPLEMLQRLGGREIAAMTGAIARARVLRLPVILDGFICCAAAAVLECEVPGALDHAIAGHQSGEQAHGRLLQAIGKAPLLSLGLRLGEGSGAALAIAVVQGALACHSGMATFAGAGVAGGQGGS